MEDEAIHWKMVAAYLASCHAATLEGLPKSAPKSARKRHADICRKAAAYLRGTDSPNRYGQPAVDMIASDIRRCDNAANKYGISA